MTSQVLNFLWLNLELPAPADPADGSIRKPLPEKYIESIRTAGKNHPAEIDLWVDSRRLTEKQLAYLKLSVEEGLPNVHVKDLRSIPAYDQEKLYNEAETNPEWRSYGQTSLIWRQVDAAKILISLQGDFDQTFFADLDYAHMDIESKEVQDMLEGPGLFIGDGPENQLWGFTRERRGFFEDYYKDALRVAYGGDNAYELLLSKLSDLEDKEDLYTQYPYLETFLYIDNDGTAAEQPGSELRDGHSKGAKTDLVPRDRLTKIFNEYGDGAYARLAVQQDGGLSGKQTAPVNISRSYLISAAL